MKSATIPTMKSLESSRAEEVMSCVEGGLEGAGLLDLRRKVRSFVRQGTLDDKQNCLAALESASSNDERVLRLLSLARAALRGDEASYEALFHHSSEMLGLDFPPPE